MVDTLVAMTYPEIRDFFNRYVWDSERLPMAEYYGKLGIRLVEGPDGAAGAVRDGFQRDPRAAGAPGGLAGAEAQARQLSPGGVTILGV